MTVKELIEILQACNQNATIHVEDGDSPIDIGDNQIFQSNDGSTVTIDLAYGEEK